MSTLLERRPGLRAEEISSAAALRALEGEWWELWERSTAATPFQTPAWLLAWWRHFGGEGLWTLAVRRADRLVGLAPLFVYRDPESGARQLTFLGNGVSDRLDLVYEPALADAVARAVMERLRSRARLWDSCDLRSLPPDSPLLARSGILPGAEVREDEPCPVLPIPEGAGAVEEVVPGKLAGNLRYSRRRAERLGPVSVEEADDRTLEGLFGALVRLHGARWRARGEPGVLDDPVVRDFHREAAAALLERGIARLYGLRIGGRLAAVHYGLIARRRAYYYLGGFDPEFERVSPGTLAIGVALEAAIREGAVELDFLRGRERYKYAWGAQDRPGYRIRATRARQQRGLEPVER